MTSQREELYRTNVQCALKVSGLVDWENQKADQTADRDCLSNRQGLWVSLRGMGKLSLPFPLDK